MSNGKSIKIVTITVVGTRQKSIKCRRYDGTESNLPISCIANYEVIKDQLRPGYSVLVEIPAWLAKKEGLSQ